MSYLGEGVVSKIFLVKSVVGLLLGEKVTYGVPNVPKGGGGVNNLFSNKN